MSGPVRLAVSGSNLTGDAPFSCAVEVGGRIASARSIDGVRGDLVAMVAATCAEASVQPDAIGEILVDVGPGSYTGLRVAVTFVRFLQHFGGVRVQALDSLALLAARVVRSGPKPAERVFAVLDARRQRVHRQQYRVAPGSVAPHEPPAAVPLEVLLAELCPGDLVIVPATLPAALRVELAAHATVRAEASVVAAEMFLPGLPFQLATVTALEPRYLMASYAES